MTIQTRRPLIIHKKNRAPFVWLAGQRPAASADAQSLVVRIGHAVRRACAYRGGMQKLTAMVLILVGTTGLLSATDLTASSLLPQPAVDVLQSAAEDEGESSRRDLRRAFWWGYSWGLGGSLTGMMVNACCAAREGALVGATVGGGVGILSSTLLFHCSSCFGRTFLGTVAGMGTGIVIAFVGKGLLELMFS